MIKSKPPIKTTARLRKSGALVACHRSDPGTQIIANKRASAASTAVLSG